MAYEDLKRIAGLGGETRVGALPAILPGAAKKSTVPTLSRARLVLPATNPIVQPSPASAMKAELGRAGARDMRLAAVSPTRAEPVITAIAKVAPTIAAETPAMQAIAAAPPALANLAVRAGTLDVNDVPPPAQEAEAVTDHHDLARVPIELPTAPVESHDTAALSRFNAIAPSLSPDIAAATNQQPPASRVIPSSTGMHAFTAVQRAPAAATPPRIPFLTSSMGRGFTAVAHALAATTTTIEPSRKGTKNMPRYKGTGEITYCPINSEGTIPANSGATLPGVRPQKPFQPQELLIDEEVGAAFFISDIKIGNEPVGVTAGKVKAANFPPSNGPKFQWKVADGVDIIFTVENATAGALAFSAMLVGEVVEQA